MAASSFATVNIRVEIDVATAARPGFERAGYVAVRHVPGSDTDVIQVMGAGLGVVTHRLDLDAAEYAALDALLLTEGALVLAGEAQGTCLLEALSGVERLVGGRVACQATFRKVG